MSVDVSSDYEDETSGRQKERQPRRALTMALRIGIPVLTFVVGAVAVLVVQRLMVGDSGAVTRMMTYQNWRVVCPPANQNLPCELNEQIAQNPGGATLVSLSVDDPTLGSPMRVTVPIGISLDPGLGIAFGKDPMKVLPFETCLQAGCFAEIALDTDTLKAMRSNKNGTVTVVPNGGKPIKIPFSLDGFSDGYARLASEQSQRHSFLSFLLP